jgi:hypothetical protein
MFQLGKLLIDENVIKEFGLGKGEAEAFRSLKRNLIAHAEIDWSKHQGVSKFSYSKARKGFTLWICTEFDYSKTKIWIVYDEKKEENNEERTDSDGKKPDGESAQGTESGGGNSSSMAIQPVG